MPPFIPTKIKACAFPNLIFNPKISPLKQAHGRLMCTFYCLKAGKSALRDNKNKLVSCIYLLYPYCKPLP